MTIITDALAVMQKYYLLVGSNRLTESIASSSPNMEPSAIVISVSPA